MYEGRALAAKEPLLGAGDVCPSLGLLVRVRMMEKKSCGSGRGRGAGAVTGSWARCRILILLLAGGGAGRHPRIHPVSPRGGDLESYAIP